MLFFENGILQLPNNLQHLELNFGHNFIDDDNDNDVDNVDINMKWLGEVMK